MSTPAPGPHLIDARLIRGGREELRIGLEPYRGFVYLSARKWWKDKAGAWQPGKGLSIRATDIPFLRVALERAEAVALEAGLLDEEAFESAGLPLPAELGG